MHGILCFCNPISSYLKLGCKNITCLWAVLKGFFDLVAGVKIKQATSVAGEVAKTASSSVAEAAERAGTVVRSRWSLLQLQQSKDGGPTVQERWRSASTVLKKNLLETKEKVVVGLSDTKEKVAIGRVKVEEVRYSYFEPLV